MIRRIVIAVSALLLLTAQGIMPGSPPGLFTNRAALDGLSVPLTPCSNSLDFSVAGCGMILIPAIIH